MKIYLAGPGVFRPDSLEYGRYLKQCCAEHGHVGFYPMDGEEDQSEAIFQANLAMIDLCDVVVANLSPFRGPSADAGTIFEVGYAYARGKTVIGWTSSVEKYLERMRLFDPYSYRTEAGHFVDLQGNLIEDFDGFDNLMIVHGVHALFSSAEEAIAKTTDIVSCRFTVAGRLD